jgi:hypothetical protein
VAEDWLLRVWYGRNVAWCYADYADAALGGVVRARAVHPLYTTVHPLYTK